MKINGASSELFFKQKVRELAYYLYVLRGCKQGRALNHWLEAENQMLAGLRYDSKVR